MLLTTKKGPLWLEAQSSGFAVAAAGVSTLWRDSSNAAIVHAHDAHAHTLAAVASRKPFVVSRRVGFPIGRGVGSRWKYRRAARYLAVSQFVVRELEAAGVHRQKIDIVYDAVQPAAQDDAWSINGPVVAPASTDPQKGRELVERAAEIAGIRVKFSDDLARDLRGASIFLYITRLEGLGSAALLAMSMGVPVIASRVGGLPEIVKDHATGLLVDNGPGEIARAIKRIAAEPELATALAARAKSMVKERFTIEHLVAATLRSYARAFAG